MEEEDDEAEFAHAQMSNAITKQEAEKVSAEVAKQEAAAAALAPPVVDGEAVHLDHSEAHRKKKHELEEEHVRAREKREAEEAAAAPAAVDGEAALKNQAAETVSRDTVPQT